MTPAAVAAFLAQWGYQAYFGLFLVTAIGSPVTEDILLLVGGYLIGEGVFDARVTVPLAVVGMVLSDVALYNVGRYLRTHTQRRGLVSRVVRPARVRQATRWFARYGDATVFVSRLLPGTRLICFVGAGMSGVRPLQFLLYDVLGALVWAPLLLWAGYRLRAHIGSLGDVLAWVEQRIFWLAIALVVFVVARQYWLRHVQQARV
jgi:membrane protein DedA with SNARE-associated domain